MAPPPSASPAKVSGLDQMHNPRSVVDVIIIVIVIDIIITITINVVIIMTKCKIITVFMP